MDIRKKFILGVWNVGIIESNINHVFKNPNDIKIRWMNHNYKDRFFADPFLESQDKKNYYILAEEFIFYEGKGKIVRLTVDKGSMKLLQKEVILNDKFHLSYPYIMNEYIIPECYRSGSMYAYKKSNDGQVYKKIRLIDQGLIDQTFLKYDNRYWVFGTSIENSKEDAKSKLSIFYLDKEGKFVPHEKNPIKIDIRTSRPGGRFFTLNNEIYRPVQDSKKRYGYFIRIMKVEKLSEDEYSEKEILSVTSEMNPPFHMGLHTFNVYSNCVVVDGYKEYHSYFLKPCMMICKNFLQIINHYKLSEGKKLKTINIDEQTKVDSIFTIEQ